MMRKKLKTALGFYNPSFMHMHVGTRKNLMDLASLQDDDAESIYLHEYVHFLQDITTTFGLANINVIADYMRFCDTHLITKPQGSFEVPLYPDSNNPLDMDTILTLHRYYDGDGDENTAKIKSITKVLLPIYPVSGKRDVEVIEVVCYNGAGKKKHFSFGADCILESMAYIIESSCYPDTVPSPDIPYHSAELIVRKMYPSLCSDRLNILALCDVSLLAFNPGSFFYTILTKMV